MDSTEFNKIFAALLTAGIAYLGLGLVAGGAVAPRHLEKTAIKIEGVAAPAETAAVSAPKGPAPIAPLLVSASADAGGADAKKLCSTCHNFAEGAGAKVGPDLYGVVGRDQASAPGFEYSSALKAHHGKWTYAELNSWIYSPKGYANGTKMAFAGIEDDKERADVIAYLRSLSHDPAPLPAPEAAPAAANAGNTQAATAGKSNAAGAASSTGAAPIGQSTQPTPNQNQPMDAVSQSQQPPAAHPATPSQEGAPGAQGKPPNTSHNKPPPHG